MNEIKPKNYTQYNKLPCDWTDKNKFLPLYKMLKFYVRHEMIVNKVHAINSHEQSKSLEKINAL